MRPAELLGIVIAAVPVALASIALVVWVWLTAGLAGAVYLAGPALLSAGAAGIAWWHRRELLAERDAADLAAANERENTITRR